MPVPQSLHFFHSITNLPKFSLRAHSLLAGVAVSLPSPTGIPSFFKPAYSGILRPSYIVANVLASSLNPVYSGSGLDILPSHLRRRDYPPSLPAQQPCTSSSRPSHLLEAISPSRRYSCLLVWPTAPTDCFNSFRKIFPLAVFGIESTNRNSQ